MALRIYLLGPPKISRDGDPIDVPGYRPLALLAYLLVTQKAHSRQHLVDLLFETSDDPRASLRWSLSKLRSAIGADYLLTDRGEVVFNFESDYWLDVAAFEAGQTDLYRGDFLEGLHLRDAYRFEDWVFFERERLRGSYQSALSQRLEECESRGDYQAVVETAHQLLRLDNLREDRYRALMRAYARLGKREAALAQYAQCRQVLETELGVEPVAETTALASAIKEGHVQPEVPEVGAAVKELRPVPKPTPQPRFATSLVGRAAEMEALCQAWRQAVAGSGQTVVVEGEPGIGKTRLVEELLAEVADGAVVLRAKCPELENPLAYTLFVDPLRQALSWDRPPGLTDTWLAEVARLLPELHDRFPDLPQPPQLDPDAERRRLFDAVCATLLSLTEERPLVLFLDDLQWADVTSLELLGHFSDWITDAPVLIIGAYRPHEVEPEHPVHRLRGAWERGGSLTYLWLEPLPEAAVRNLLQELTTWRGDDPSFGSLIYRETGGNPLFVVETVASLRDEGRLPESADGWQRDFGAETLTIPSGVQTIIETRLNRLDDLSYQLITAAAVTRSGFRAGVVQAASGRSELETLEGLERLLAGGLIVEEGKDRFTFSHDKIREVAYGSLSQLRRKLLHRRMAETLERRHRGREKLVAERLAYHYEAADVSDKATEYYLQAGHMARERYAHEAAVSHYRKALAYLKAQGDYGRAARTLMQLGLTYHIAFDFHQARQTYQEGFALWQRMVEMQPAVSLPPAPHALRVSSFDPLTLDPAMSFDTTSTSIIEELFSGLVELGPDMEVIPDVAQSWEVSEGGHKYVFHLRDDVRWSDGASVTAGDFEYAWKRVLNPATKSPVASLLYDIKGASAVQRGEVPDPDQVRVQALDKVTLTVELEEPTGHLLQLLAYTSCYPVPRHVVEEHGEAWTDVGKIVTNGPFRLDIWQPKQSMVVSRNPEFHTRFTGNLQRVKLRLLGDQPVQLEMYEAGDLDILDLGALSPMERDRARQLYAEEYVTGPSLSTTYVGFVTSRPPFNDPRVRRAFVMVTDRETLAHVVMGGYVSPAMGGFVPLGMPGHTLGIGLPYDPGQARQLLAEAGYLKPTDSGFPVVELLAPRDVKSAVEYLETQWRETLGLELKVEIMEHATMLRNRLDTKPTHLFAWNWMADYPDPDNFLRASPVRQDTRWRNQDYEELVEEARQVMDQGERMKLYQQADKILVEEAAIVPLYYGRNHLLVKPWVRGNLVSPMGGLRWKDVILEPH